MSAIVLKDPYISIGGTDMSDHFRSVSISVSAELQDMTAFGDDWQAREAGLKDWSLTCEYVQDYAAGELDATLWPLVGTSVALVVRPQSGAVGRDESAVRRQRSARELRAHRGQRRRARRRQRDVPGRRSPGPDD